MDWSWRDNDFSRTAEEGLSGNPSRVASGQNSQCAVTSLLEHVRSRVGIGAKGWQHVAIQQASVQVMRGRAPDPART